MIHENKGVAQYSLDNLLQQGMIHRSYMFLPANTFFTLSLFPSFFLSLSHTFYNLSLLKAEFFFFLQIHSHNSDFFKKIHKIFLTVKSVSPSVKRKSDFFFTPFKLQVKFTTKLNGTKALRKLSPFYNSRVYRKFLKNWTCKWLYAHPVSIPNKEIRLKQTNKTKWSLFS